ncbi:MAG: LD-carboxypeptidase [Ignavibacteriaceae bacterium]
MRVVKPKRLQKGDTIGIISPASSPDDLSRTESGVKYFEKLGYRVEVGKHVGKFHGYLAGTDEERIEDIHNMFKNKDVKAIIAVRGGYGTLRLLDKIDFKIIKNNPKIFVGYSDITALQMAMFAKTGLVTFAGPMVAVDFYDEVSPYTEESFWELLTNNKKPGKIAFPEGEKIFEISKGKVRGRVIGGNLALVASLAGTDYLPDMKEKILFLEDTAEAPYRIDRMLTQLKLAKVFKHVKGVILGAFTDCVESNPEKRTLTLGEVIEDHFAKLKIPVVYNFPHGHVKNNFTLPLGVQISLNTGRHIIEITESAVS